MGEGGLRDSRGPPPPVDVFVCFGSVSATLPMPGQFAYAAANAYVEGLCASRRQRGRAAVAVHWGVLP